MTTTNDLRLFFCKTLGFPTKGGFGPQLKAWLATAKRGDTLVVDDLYEFSGGPYNVPAGVKIAALDKMTCGFKFIDSVFAATYGQPQYQGDRFRAAGDDVELHNLRLTQDTITDADIARLASSGWGTVFNDMGHSNCKMTDCFADNVHGWGIFCTAGREGEFARNVSANAKIHVLVRGGTTKDTRIHSNRISGGYRNGSNMFGDAIKTESSGQSTGPERLMVYNNVFDSITRDAVDTTGGWYAGLCTGNQFIGCGLDLKNHSERVLNVGTSVAITGISQSNPTVVTAPGHGAVTGQHVNLINIAGMTQLNNRGFVVKRIDDNTFSLDGENSTTYTAYVSGGLAIVLNPEATKTRRNEALLVEGNVFTGGAITVTFGWNNPNLCGPMNAQFKPKDMSFNNNYFIDSRVFIKDGDNLTFDGNTFRHCFITASSMLSPTLSRNIIFKNTTWIANDDLIKSDSTFNYVENLVLDFVLFDAQKVGGKARFRLSNLKNAKVTGNLTWSDPVYRGNMGIFLAQGSIDTLHFALDQSAPDTRANGMYQAVLHNTATIGKLVYGGSSKNISHLIRNTGVINKLEFLDFRNECAGGVRNSSPGTIARPVEAWNTICAPTARLLANDVLPVENAWHRSF